jgi:hypothetical protein
MTVNQKQLSKSKVCFQNFTKPFGVCTFSWFQTFAVFWMSYVFFWAVLQHMAFNCQHFRTLCSIFTGEWVWSVTAVENFSTTLTIHTQEGMLRNFSPEKIRRLRPGANPRSWVPEASMLTTRPPKLLYILHYWQTKTKVLYLFSVLLFLQ